ncbi:DUF2507 domain-containing protein [Alkalibacterium kapii]|uniref:DUF2507 domain-containing protein n=1 Tax=Alkalibacterium kapii TaxID=426704 RepID=A0A511AVD2_9LACT|nr:DUF2507 domain-containing protein [Alkalibacterium kapii]GEK92155.1 hypothetical protein AKA01nite_17770 [Alkalibacterium kapii]
MQTENESLTYLNSLSLLRDTLLPNLLKDNEADILYFAGKELARSHAFDSLDDLIQQMNKRFAGQLVLSKKTKKALHYEWSGSFVSHRLSHETNATFSLEAGFLAAGYQQITDHYAEATYTVHPKKSIVTLLLQSDTNFTD